MRWRRAVVVAVTLALALTGLLGYRQWQGTQAANSTKLEPVLRNNELTVQALAATALHLDIDKFRLADAWLEPQCDGVGLYLRTDETTMWVWYDLLRAHVTELLLAEDVLATVREVTPVETNAYTWQFFDGPGHRLRYYLGTNPQGQDVLVRFRTEECGLGPAYLERTDSPEQQGRMQEIAFTPQEDVPRTKPRYQDLTDSEPPIPRMTDETREAQEAVQEYAGLGSHGVDAWVEPACNQVFVFMYTDAYGNYSSHWGLYDLKSNQLVEYLNHEDIIDAVHAQWPEENISLWNAWRAWHDAPGRRSRYKIGFIGLNEAWLHFNSKECSLLPAQIQLARNERDVGEWVTLPITDAAVSPEDAPDSERDGLTEEEGES